MNWNSLSIQHSLSTHKRGHKTRNKQFNRVSIYERNKKKPQYLRFLRNLGGLTNSWVRLTTHNIFGLGSTLWPGSPTPGPILLVKPKIHLVPPIGLEWIFSYIFVNALMENFNFGIGKPFFEGVIGVKKFFWVFTVRLQTNQKMIR